MTKLMMMATTMTMATGGNDDDDVDGNGAMGHEVQKKMPQIWSRLKENWEQSN